MTTARYTGYGHGDIEVLQDGRVIATLDVARFCAIDGALRDVAERAMEIPGACVPVPAVSFARGIRPRNHAHGVRQ